MAQELLRGREAAVWAKVWQQSPKQLSAAKSAWRVTGRGQGRQAECAYPLGRRLYKQRPLPQALSLYLFLIE